MTDEQDERLKRVEHLLAQLLDAVLAEDEDAPALSLDGTRIGAPRDPVSSLG